MTVQILVRNNCNVHAYRNGKLTAKAVRGTTETAWHVGALNSLGVFEVLAEIHPNTSEVLGRKLVQAMLREIA